MEALMIGDGLPSNQIVINFILFGVGNVNVCEGIKIDVTKQIHDKLCSSLYMGPLYGPLH